MRVGVLAVQGAFAEHMARLRALGADCAALRQRRDLDDGLCGLVLPGGESTTQGRLLRELDMLEPLRARIRAGLPVLATCAGLILLAERVAGEDTAHLGTLPVTVRRNAYGRQLASFHTRAAFRGLGMLPMTFIRAPYIVSAGPGVETLAEVDGRIVAARAGKQLGVCFHPELDDDMALHRLFLEMAAAE